MKEEEKTRMRTGERDQKEKASLTGTATTSRHRKDKTSETAHSTVVSEKVEPRSVKGDKVGRKKKRREAKSKMSGWT